MELKPIGFLRSKGMRKYAAVILLGFLLIFPAHFQAQTSVKLTLSFSNAPLEDVFREIKRQSGFGFIYTTEQLQRAKPVTVQLKDASLQQALEACFKNQPLSYVVEDDHIAVREAAGITNSIPKELRGLVVDEDESPLPNATITIKGKNRMTSTDENGAFVLSNIEDDDVLIVTSVGYKEKEIPVKGRSFIKLSMQIRISTLDETVVIAYGTTTKKLNTGTISKVKSQDIGKQPVSNPLAALQGRVPGLIITQVNGLPGSKFNVLIRGQHSIQQGNDPLFVVDGVPFVSENLTQRSSIQTHNPFNTINPADIESIEVLKDADATAIYGSRGAGGVILITTKKAKTGRLNVNASLYHGWGKVTRKQKLMNTKQYVAMRKEAFANDGVTPQLSNAYDFLAWDSTRYTDWQDLLIGGTARSSNAQVKLSGGTAFTKFGFGANYYRESTVFPGDKWADRISFNFTGTHQSADNRFSINLSAMYGHDQSRMPKEDLAGSIFLPPTAPPPFDSAGNLNWSENNFNFTNPFAKLLQDYEGLTEMLNTSLTLSYRITKGLVLRSSAGFNRITLDELVLTPIASQSPVGTPYGIAAKTDNSVKNWIIEPQLEYSLGFSRHAKLQLLAGGSFQNKTQASSILDGTGFTDDRFLRLYSSAPSLKLSNKATEYKYRGAFGRARFNWKDKFLLNVSARRDGSSRFGPGKQWANFGAVGAGYVFSEEQFFKKQSALSFGKLRVSYGTAGNDQIGDYQYLDSWSPTAYPYLNSVSIEPSRIANPSYSWELSRKLEAALELGFLKNRIELNINWYKNRTVDQIINYRLPTQTGFFSVLKNFPGIVENRGWEFDFISRNIVKSSFTWTTFFNASVPKNILVAFPGLESSTYSTAYRIGEPLSVHLGYHWLGVDSATGIYQFEDINKDGSLTSADYHVVGSTMPRFYGGFGNEFRYKKWTLDFLFQFVSQKGLNQLYSGANGGLITNQSVRKLDRWQKPGDRTAFQKFSQQTSGPIITAANRLTTSDAFLTDASFIRLKNVSLSWSLPDAWLRKLNATDCRLYLRAQNLLTITDYQVADPESQSIYALPPLRMMVVGIEFNF